MPHHMAFCSACDRPVPVDLKPGSGPPRDDHQDAGDVVCLEYPSRCTASMCPMFSIQDDESRADARARRDPAPQ